jgi:hypothetical protein
MHSNAQRSPHFVQLAFLRQLRQDCIELSEFGSIGKRVASFHVKQFPCGDIANYATEISQVV